MNRHGELVLTDDAGRERERYALTYGAKLLVQEGQKVPAKTLLSEWDPFSMPIVTEVGGILKYGDIIDQVTMQEQLDEVTGLSRKVIIESKDADTRPRISVKDDARQDQEGPGLVAGGALLPAGRREHLRQRRRPHRGRRRHRQDPARDHEDQGHHRRSAARRRALRGAQAEGARGHQRDRRHRVVRQGHQGQAQGGHHARSRRAEGVPDLQGQAPVASAKAIAFAPASR